jgi:hypothetical protein
MSRSKAHTPSIIILHAVIILLAYSSPFWLDWRLVALGIIANYIQILVVGGCVLSHAQFEDKGQSFHEWYLRKLGIKVNRRHLNFILRWIIPFVLLATAILFQVVAGVKVIASF